MKITKTIVRIIVIGLLVFCTVLCARSTDLKFTWTQVIPADMGGWRIYKSQSSNGPWTQIFHIGYVSEQAEYTITRAVEAPDDQVTTYYFTISAYDTTGNESEKYTPAQLWTFDYQAPQKAITFIISVEE
jgi:hypothetical protein